MSDVQIIATENITQDVFDLNARSDPYRASISIQISSTTIGTVTIGTVTNVSKLFAESWKNSCALLSFGLKYEVGKPIEYSEIRWFDRTLLTREVLDNLVSWFEILNSELSVSVSTGATWVPPDYPYR